MRRKLGRRALLGGLGAALAVAPIARASRSQPLVLGTDLPERFGDVQTELVGTSVEGRPIWSWTRRPSAEMRARLLMICAVHGDEPLTQTLARHALDMDLFPNVELVIVPELNPDGVARGDRFNANGVDLNRNFPHAWAAYDGGPAPLSEPEPRAAVDLVESLNPHLTAWVHQPLNWVGWPPGADPAYADTWADHAGVQRKGLVKQHGGGSWWTASTGRQSILVEFDDHLVTPGSTQIHDHLRGLHATMSLLQDRYG